MSCGCRNLLAPSSPAPPPPAPPSSAGSCRDCGVSAAVDARVSLVSLPAGAAMRVLDAQASLVGVEIAVSPAATGPVYLIAIKRNGKERPRAGYGIPIGAGGVWFPRASVVAGNFEVWAFSATADDLTVQEFHR